MVEKYLWQGLTRLLAVYDGNNNLLMRFEYADDRMPVAMKMGGSTYYLSYDQVGSLRAGCRRFGQRGKKNKLRLVREHPGGHQPGLHDTLRVSPAACMTATRGW